MTEVESLQTEFLKLKEALLTARKEQRFELLSILRYKENELNGKVKSLIIEVQSITKYAAMHFETSA